jgi:hypothetical protein
MAAGGCLLATTVFGAAHVGAAPPDTSISGAIFTTDYTGESVNLNLYAAKEDVYLNGGPGINAPADAAGLPDGTYSFQVTDPSGKTPLSTDLVACRQFTVLGGVIQDVVAQTNGCEHATGADGEDGGATVQLFPYADTPNNGGVYKVWVSPTSLLDCTAPGNKFCFVPRYSKTDNFKVKSGPPIEIDVRFSRHDTSGYIDGLAATKTDTLGASNLKWSEYNPAILAFHEAHFEAVEPGLHHVTVTDQLGCVMIDAHGPDGTTYVPSAGSVTIPVTISKNVQRSMTYFVDVHCA